MATEDFKRKLAAIISADVKGYSRLMEEDEATTVQTLKARRELMTSFIEQHRGRVVDSPGDNLLAEFASVVEAVECAVKIQEELKAKNAELPQNRRMEFRIGVHLGDVIEDEGRIYGDGVNIAARIEGMAEAGGICISRTAYDSVKNKLNLGFEYLGEHTVKNISEPVQVYRVLTDPESVGSIVYKRRRDDPRHKRRATIIALLIFIVGMGAFAIWNYYLRQPSVEPASVEKMAFPLPDKPSIAVLPFANMSSDPEQEYFSDGITEEIITALSKTPKLFVIARNSTFTYKGKPVKVQQVGRELGVRYVLEGSVRKSEDRLRITAQLIDALTGKHLWAERYERPLGELFAVQDAITLAIVRAMQVSLTDGEQARLIGKGTKNLEAYLKAKQAQEQFSRMNRQGSVKAKEIAKEAIALDPKYAFPYTTLANAHMLDVWFNFSESPKESMKLAADAAQKALALDDSDPIIYSTLTNLYVMQRQYDKAIASAERDLELSPGGGRAHVSMAIALLFACRFDESIPFFEQAIRLNPYPPDSHIRLLGSAYRAVGRYDEALIAYKKALQLNPNDIFTHLGLASVYVSLNRIQDARAEANEVSRLHPKFSLDHFAKTLSLKDQSAIDEFVATLRKAGLK